MLNELRLLIPALISCFVLFSAGCAGSGNRDANTNLQTQSSLDAPTLITRPGAIIEAMGRRGDQDKALPELKIYEPKANSVSSSSTVRVAVELGGILKGFALSDRSETTKGNHIRVVLDNKRWGEIRSLDVPFEFRDVADGDHTITVIPVRPWGESYKNDGAMQTVKFTVKNGGVSAPPETEETADIEEAFLTLISPSPNSDGNLKNPVMVDFALSNVRLADRGGNYRVSFSINGEPAQFVDKLEPIWISGVKPGVNRVRLELVDRNGKLVKNGSWNSVEREFSIVQ